MRACVARSSSDKSFMNFTKHIVLDVYHMQVYTVYVAVTLSSSKHISRTNYHVLLLVSQDNDVW